MAASVGFGKHSNWRRNHLWQTDLFGLLSTTNVPLERWEESVVLSADIPKRDEVVEAFKVCVNPMLLLSPSIYFSQCSMHGQHTVSKFHHKPLSL
jgi:hypothetical protein